ncbi:MAG: hypothetical protein AAF328_03915 [Planctomycetota bacterium]
MRVWFLVLLIGIAGAASADALDDGRARQAATYMEGAHPDQPALYALLADAAEWHGDARDEAGAVVVDWSAVLERPADFRGAKVLVEGRDAGRRRRVSLVREQRPWGAAVTEWGVGLESAPGNAPESFPGRTASADREPAELPPVVVWFVDPQDQIGEAQHGRTVRVAGRFLGLWDDVDANGTARTYPVVIAKGATVVAEAKTRGAGGWETNLFVLLTAVLGLGLLWRVSKAFVRVDVVGRRRAARIRTDNPSAASEAEIDGALPEEAGAALSVLAGEREKPTAGDLGLGSGVDRGGA